MNIFAIFLLLIIILLNLKIKVSIYFKSDNFDTHIEVKLGTIKFKRNGTLVKRKKKYVIKKKSISKKKLVAFLKYIEINKLNINLIVGTPFLLFTIFSVPILATALERVKAIPFKKLENYSYVVLPNYNEFKLFSEIEAEFKIKVFDLIRTLLSKKDKSVPF